MAVREFQAPVEAPGGVREPGVFLIGPIQGAPNWQREGIGYMRCYEPFGNVSVYNPRRDHYPVGETDAEKEAIYRQQVRWEKAHIYKAARYGSVVIWLAAKNDSLDYPEGREYAKTTKKELVFLDGLVHAGLRPKLSVGVDPAFDGEAIPHYQQVFLEDYGIPVLSDLEEVCDRAMKLASVRST